jgi:hypothetical protein
MPRSVGYVMVLGLFSLAGCDAVSNLIAPSTVTVSLVNDSAFDVEAEVWIADQQEIPEFLLDQIGERLDFTVPAGETTTFSRSCDELQAIVIKKADLRIIGDVGPEADTEVLRDGTDFGCGDRIIFSFTHSALVVDFHITTDVQ